MPLAIFDLDNTLLKGDSDHAWGQFLAERQVVGPEHGVLADRYLADYEAGRLDIDEFLRFQLLPLKDNDRADLERWRGQYLQTKILPMITDPARTLVNMHRARGDTLMIITATNRFITQPIAAEFGVEILIATEPEMVDGQYTGRVAGAPCFQHGKLTHLEDWLTAHDETLKGSWFYSDSHNDLPLLESVDHPVAVNPDPILLTTANERKWPVLSLWTE